MDKTVDDLLAVADKAQSLLFWNDPRPDTLIKFLGSNSEYRKCIVNALTHPESTADQLSHLFLEWIRPHLDEYDPRLMDMRLAVILWALAGINIERAVRVVYKALSEDTMPGLWMVYGVARLVLLQRTALSGNSFLGSKPWPTSTEAQLDEFLKFQRESAKA